MNKSKMLATLEDVKTLFEEQSYTCEIQMPTELSSREQLVVQLPLSIDNNAALLRIFWSTSNEEFHADDPKFLTFFVLLPVVITESSFREVISLLLSINAMFDMASFGIYEADRLIYYRYVHVCSSHGATQESTLAVFASLIYLLETMLPYFLDVALGYKSLEVIQNEAKDLLRQEGVSLP